MKVDFISDLHIDFWVKERNPESPKLLKQIKKYCEMIDAKGGELLLIAGDLGHYFTQDSQFLLYMKTLYKNVIFVRGNHDMYLVSGKQQMKYEYDWKKRMQEYKDFCKENDIYYLDGETVEINGYKFAGIGMSWDKSFYETKEKRIVKDQEVKEFYNNTMNDSRLIFNESDNYYIPLAYGGKYWHSKFDPFEYFQQEMEKLKKIEKVDLVVSHYAPINPYSEDNEYKDELSSTFYMFDGIEEAKRIDPKYWVFGHMHKSVDINVENINFLCNPLGYPDENTYTTVKTIDLGV